MMVKYPPREALYEKEDFATKLVCSSECKRKFAFEINQLAV